MTDLKIPAYSSPDIVQEKLHSCEISLKFVQFFLSFGQKRPCVLRDFVSRCVFSNPGEEGSLSIQFINIDRCLNPTII